MGLFIEFNVAAPLSDQVKNDMVRHRRDVDAPGMAQLSLATKRATHAQRMQHRGQRVGGKFGYSCGCYIRHEAHDNRFGRMSKFSGKSAIAAKSNLRYTVHIIKTRIQTKEKIMNTSDTQKHILVIGGTGKTGRRIVQGLEAQGHSVRVGSRSSDIPFSWDAPENWEAVLDGCESAYVAYSPDLAVPGASDSIRYLCQVAKKVGLQKIVLLSGRGEPEAQTCEQIVQHSGLTWTILRCAWFNQNFSESFLHPEVMSGTIALPVGNIKEPFVDVDDIAEVAIAALTEERHDDKLYELTGPELISFPQLANIFSEKLGRPIEYVQISQEAFIAGLEAQALPENLVKLLDYLFTVITDGRNEFVANGVEQALGRPARSFTHYVERSAQTGVWAQQPQTTEAAQ